ncbi:MAG: sodium:calcium antiporter [Candidatus Nanoarchaeia archaeon]
MVLDVMTASVFVMSLLVLGISAQWIIKAASNIARQLGVSTYFIGFSIIAIGTSLPEMVSGIFASLEQHGTLVLGNVLGANLLDATVVIGLAAIVGRKVTISGKLFKTFDETLLMSLGILLFPFLLGMDGVLSRLDGSILLGVFGFYVWRLYNRAEDGHGRKHLVWGQLLKDIFFLAVGMPALIIAAHVFVGAATQLALDAGISLFIIGITIVSLGTTLPELVVQMTAVLDNKSGIGFGDTIGSIISNITLVLGVAAIINPLVFEPVSFLTAAAYMFMATFIALLFLHRRVITWKEGVALFVIYGTFLISEVFLLA